ncbi:phage portal protein [Aeromicrobium sp. 9AM]|uniref:phage portal protein n=1 Tax=Aeromicrobium sp. 9AM TaxID=2653126 RepID=UPI0012F0BA0D|nr:phage portal protein [Aeromicrobium sp. 9AM]VXB82312.1 putative Phage portal protein, A118 family [Aeromicrobium sp. 9AM]
MPLPRPNTLWPPADFGNVAAKYAEHSAWYSGDPGELQRVYTRVQSTTRIDKPAQYRGGAVGAVARFWWGRPLGDLTKRRDFLHVPLASDICQASADLLFAEPPSIKSDHAGTQTLLDDLADNGILSTMAESAELSAALGGGFQRVTWDANRPEGAFITNIDADGAYPVFRWKELVEVTFWWEVQADDQVVWRHLEHHELDSQGVGVIFHQLFKGTKDNLGTVHPLEEHPSTQALAGAVDAESKISTQSPGLAVEYFPNQYPQRLLRKDPLGRNLGRSDLAGIEGIMDAIDEAYSSWMRDVRLGKGRIIVPGYMLQSAGRGQGAFFDLDQDVYEKLNVPPSTEGDGVPITDVQFEIRVEQHAATVTGLVKAALRTAGYSAETFGEDAGGGMKTATEVVSEQNRSYLTRDRKIRLLMPRQLRILRKLLAVDKAIFSKDVDPEQVDMEFADAVQADPEALARTAQALRVAQAASTKTLVSAQHPDWDAKQIDDEVALIVAENSMSVDLPPMPGDPEAEPADVPPAPE